MKNICYLLLSFLIVLYSCQKEVLIEIPDHDPLLVVNSYLKNEKIIKVHISQSGQMLEPLDSFVSGAKVIILHEGVTDTLSQQPDRWYCSDLLVKKNIRYNIKVLHTGFTTVEAVDSIPGAVPFQLKNYVAKEIVDDWGDIFSSVDVVFKDNPDQINYYEVSATIKNHIRNLNTIYFWAGVTCNDMIIKNENIDDENYGNALPFSDQLFNGDTVSLRITFAYNPNIDYVDIILRSVSKNYYQYKKSLFRYYEGSFANVWSGGNPVGLYSNIENGYGIFAGYSEYVDSIYTYAEIP